MRQQIKAWKPALQDAHTPIKSENYQHVSSTNHQLTLESLSQNYYAINSHLTYTPSSPMLKITQKPITRTPVRTQGLSGRQRERTRVIVVHRERYKDNILKTPQKNSKHF